jgi:hypothetical protein
VTWILLALLAHDPVTTKIMWTVEISRIVNRRCISCHGAGASVDLSSYESARPWAVSIRNQVLQRTMPPWGAVKGFGEFRHDPSLTALEIEMITQWVEGGAPDGDPKMLPVYLPKTVTETAHFRWMPAPVALQKSQTIAAIRAAGQTEASAILPDGTARHLLWIRDRQPNYKQVYAFREPIILPAGTKFSVTGARVELGF